MIRSLLSRQEIRRGAWLEERATVPCGIVSNGALVKFFIDDVKKLLDEKYPYDAEKEVWFFNESKDREIAELSYDGFVYANPQLLWRHYLP